MTILAAMLLAATYNGCPITHASYPPLVIHACGQVYLSQHTGLAVYSHDSVLTVPGPMSADRLFASSFQ